MKLHIDGISSHSLQARMHSRPLDAHKGTMGHALLVAGSKGMAGAAILSAEACLRSGIGKLSILTPEENRIMLQITVPEAILAHEDNLSSPFDAIGIGPGMGRHTALMEECLLRTHQPLVLDADALNMLSTHPEWMPLVVAGSIFTPHPKEAERLLGSQALEDVSDYACRHGIYIILKGHPTHVCTPEGDVYRMNVGNPGMATAGSGDVLTGIVTGLLAQGYPSLNAALMGVWLHGMAGDFSRDELGEDCMLARDIIRHLPDAFRRLKNE